MDQAERRKWSRARVELEVGCPVRAVIRYLWSGGRRGTRRSFSLIVAMLALLKD